MLDGHLTDEFARVAALHRYDVLDTPPEEPFDRITAIIKSITKAPMVSVSLIDRERQWFKSCIGLDVRETPRDVSFCTHTIMQREPMIVEDATRDDRFRDNVFVKGQPFIRFYAGVPLMTPDGYNIGALCVLDIVPRRFSDAQITMLKSFAQLVIGELELRRIAQVDHLTGALTRRAFVAELDRALSDYRRSGTPASLVMFDIDHFKQINDVHGHQAGDLVLRHLAMNCSDAMRTSESFGRLGGEEFALLLPRASLTQAAATAERFRVMIEEMVVPGDPPLKVTSSFGVTSLGAGCITSDEVIAEADKALYQAKNSGRNQVVTR